MVRPIKHLLDKKYELTPDLDLQSLPLEALQSVSKKISTKLQTAGINSIPELANASVELKVEGISQKEIKKAISYAQDVMKHASEPGIQEGIMPLEEMLDKKHETTPVNELAGLELEAIQGLTKTDAAKIRKASVGSTIQELAGVDVDNLRSVGLTDYKASRIVEFAKMIMTYTKGAPVVEPEPVAEPELVAEPKPVAEPESVPTKTIAEKKVNIRNLLVYVAVIGFAIIVTLYFLIIMMP